MSDNRLNGADFVRAAACLTVLFHHLAQRMSWQDKLGGVEWFRVFAQIGTFGVAMFFVLSGFLLSRPFWQALDRGEPAPSLRVYAMRRAARILPGFWLALLVSFVLSITVFGAVLDGQLVLRLVAGIFTVADWHWITLFPVEVNGPLWSISFEVTSYLLLPLGFAALFFLGRWSGTGWQSRLLWVGVIGLALVAHWLFARYVQVDAQQRGWDHGLIGGAKYWMPRFNPFGFFAMFAIGALAGGLQVRWAKYRHALFDLIAVAAFAWGIYLMQQQLSAETSDGWGWLGVPYGFPWFVLAVGLFLSTSPSSAVLGQLLDNPVTRYIAKISFGIYIWHYPVLELVRVYWDPKIDHGQSPDPTRFVVTCAIITVITFIVAHLSYHLVEKPVIQWARGKERRRVGSATVSAAAE
ncbi:MAG TPA: acyltransferase [Devosia sp.]|jgi:peptidoglycan/LPS O-acetylase OafA/YrhL|uniref:acyltransferase family protein n=1 Tax=Devosia sp. TaxID=1871048 RepID=UPI002DDD866F|nr:acyltransferase [Devosia sp.]HEV2517545.1 acyltransferase [Devosia sp.]